MPVQCRHFTDLSSQPLTLNKPSALLPRCSVTDGPAWSSAHHLQGVTLQSCNLPSVRSPLSQSSPFRQNISRTPVTSCAVFSLECSMLDKCTSPSLVLKHKKSTSAAFIASARPTSITLTYSKTSLTT